MDRVERIKHMLSRSPFVKEDSTDKAFSLFESKPINAILIHSGEYAEQSQAAGELLKSHRIFSLADHPVIKICVDRKDIEQYLDRLFDPLKGSNYIFGDADQCPGA